MSDSDIRLMEAQNRTPKYGPSGIHPDRINIENMDESQIRTLETAVAEQRQQDIPFRQYLRDLITNPRIFDEKEFESATIRSMQSNRIIKEFIENLIDKINQKTFEFKSLDKNDKEAAQTLKSELENLIVIYEKYLYKLKENDWNFQTPGCSLYEMKLPDDVMEDLWQIQRNFDVTFNMLIPADMGEYYGQKFERKGNMVPGLRLMYDDLIGKEVNWHQVIIYKENELTPHQRYLQSQEEKRKAFENARQQEINSVLNQVREMTEESIGGKSI